MGRALTLKEQGKRSLRWDLDRAILERVDEHGRLVRAGWTRSQICRQQGIDDNTYHRDEQRLIELARRAAGQDEAEQRMQADRWLRECIADSDRLTEAAQDFRAKSEHQGNKRQAVDSFIKLWGLNKATKSEQADAALRGVLALRLADGFNLPPLEADFRPSPALLPEGGAHGG